MLTLVEDVTIVIPTIAPRKAQLQRALESVYAQTVTPVNIIITEDENKKGAAFNRNNGLMAVTSEWTAFLDDDDYFYPDHLKLLMRHAKRSGADLVYPWFDVIGGTDPLAVRVDGKLVNPFNVKFGDEQRDYILNEGNFIPVTTVVRTEIAQQVGGFPQPGSMQWSHESCEDWGFLVRMLKAGAKFEHLPRKTWAWTHWGHNTSGMPSKW